ncbi:hypothetical protein [Acetivibrio clariflavus]|uniref:hypothetical protein n=1 Tax=Acetivibrio clariflavus TaxID=288965 RepID=UPI000482B25D|nr:hypothetical protein [Acetivibrio clariflavus]
MKLRLLISALTNYRNLGILIVLSVLSSSLESDMSYIAYVASFVVYLGFSLQSFTSKKFQDNFIHESKKKQIKNLDEMCKKLADETKAYTNAAYYKKLCSIMEDKTEIVQAYFKDEFNYLKERITEQTLNLVITYIKLLKNFCKRCRDLNLTDINPIIERINQNRRKLDFIKDQKVYEDLKKTIEMDEKILNRLKEEKQDLERIDTKLDYIKSTVSMFKHQIGMSMESEEMIEKIENTLNEATALESVLEKRHKKRNSAF